MTNWISFSCGRFTLLGSSSSREAQIARTTWDRYFAKVLGKQMPTLVPATSGNWNQISDREIQFTPTGYGYGLNTRVQVVLPDGVRLVGGQSTTATSATSGIRTRISSTSSGKTFSPAVLMQFEPRPSSVMRPSLSTMA